MKQHCSPKICWYIFDDRNGDLGGDTNSTQPGVLQIRHICAKT